MSEEYKSKTVYPKVSNIFRAILSVPYKEIKVVVLGQDPYHGPGQANGFAFAVEEGVHPPPSLRNILREVASDTGVYGGKDITLESWVRQGVLLLNSSLTVRDGEPNSHEKHWAPITDRIISVISEREDPVIFVLWGNFAKSKAKLINRRRHAILEAGHPSPLSARYFFGCRHFSKANDILKKMNKSEIDWTLVCKKETEYERFIRANTNS